MGMLAREIPKDFRDEMANSESIDLGWSRNFPSLCEPNGTRPVRSFYPGWKLLKQHVRIEDALPLMQEASSHHPIVGNTWEEIEQSRREDGEPYHLPLLPSLLQLLARALGKTVYVTNVGMSDGAGIYDEITVYRIPPEGKITWIDV